MIIVKINGGEQVGKGCNGKQNTFHSTFLNRSAFYIKDIEIAINIMRNVKKPISNVNYYIIIDCGKRNFCLEG